MAVKPAEGTVVTETRTTEVRNQTPEKPERLPELWDFVDTLAPNTSPDSPEYQFTIYRGTKAQKAEDREWIGKFYERMSRERIQADFGGGEYNVWLKLRVGRGSVLELKYNVDLKIAGAPKVHHAQPGSSSSAMVPAAGDATAQLIALFRDEMRAMRDEMRGRGGDLQIDAIRQALTLNGQVFASGADSLRSTLAGAGGGGRDPLIEKLLTASIERLVNPPAANSLADTLQTLKLFKESGLMGDGGAGKANMTLELVRQVPSIATTLVRGIEQWRLAEEARARTIAIHRAPGAPPPINVPPLGPGPLHMPVALSPAEAAAQQNPLPTGTQIPLEQIPGQEATTMSIEVLEQMLVSIIQDPNNTIEQAANEACSLIDRAMPGQLDMMIAQGEEVILNLFRSRPVLSQVAEHPRLPDFVKKLIEVGKSAPVAQPVNINAPVA